VNAGDGDDTINAMDGEVDTIDCGAGRDVVQSDSGDIVTTCERSSRPGEVCGEVSTGTDAGEHITGTLASDGIYAGGGDDLVDGLDETDCIFGEAGNDSLFGQFQGDRIDGGDGNDRVVGELGADQLFGGPGDDRLNGGDGVDRMDGSAGNDILKGGNGSDRIEAVDQELDRINCGKGKKDRVRADSGDKVKKSCEKVKRISP
jgi:Ca2+-binding RTX toxin-like protein